jgi:hypothetical protein
MDIFNRKRVAELEEKVRKLEAVESENDRLRRELDNAVADLRDIIRLKDTTPSDCIQGEYCRDCIFGEKITNTYYVSGYNLSRCYNAFINGYICKRGNVCKNLIQKEKTNDTN